MNRSKWPANIGTRRVAAMLLLSAGFVISPQARAAEARHLERDFAVGSQRDLELQMPFGELTVVAGDGDQVRVELDMECKHGWGDGAKRLERIDIEQGSHGDRLTLEVTGMNKRSNHGLNVKMRATVPKALALEVRMGAGEVRIEAVRADLQVHLGAGDIDIRMSEDDVRSVDLRAAVGDANLKLSHGRVESERSHLIGGQVHWNRGPGDAEIDVQVGAGDIEVRLD